MRRCRQSAVRANLRKRRCWLLRAGPVRPPPAVACYYRGASWVSSLMTCRLPAAVAAGTNRPHATPSRSAGGNALVACLGDRLDIIARLREGAPPGSRQIEIVERKGLGHPDTMCDALAEQISVRLCRKYLERFGRILHHNVDKILLVAGRARVLRRRRDRRAHSDLHSRSRHAGAGRCGDPCGRSCD